MKRLSAMVLAFFLVSCEGGFHPLDDPDFVSNSTPGTVAYDSQALLDAEGGWSMVEQYRDNDPALAHARAKQKVNVNSFRKRTELAAHFEPDARSGEDGTLRILRLQPGDATQGSMVLAKKPLDRVFDPSRNAPLDYQVIPPRKPSFLASASGAIRHVVTPPSMPARKIMRDAPTLKTAMLMASIETSAPATAVPVPSVKPHRYVHQASYGGSKGVGKLARAINIRAGRHPGKERFVIEVTQPTEYKASVDNIRGVLSIALDKAQWDLPPQNKVVGSALFGSYVARDMGNGRVVVEVRLKKKTRIHAMMRLQPNSVSQHRIVVDLQA